MAKYKWYKKKRVRHIGPRNFIPYGGVDITPIFEHSSVDTPADDIRVRRMRGEWNPSTPERLNTLEVQLIVEQSLRNSINPFVNQSILNTGTYEAITRSVRDSLCDLQHRQIIDNFELNRNDNYLDVEITPVHSTVRMAVSIALESE